jgi:hypothetical protein
MRAFFITIVVVLATFSKLHAQTPTNPANANPVNPGQWRPPATGSTGNANDTSADGTRTAPLAPIHDLKPITRSPTKRVTQISAGPASLPDDQGQVWREYNISPYTLRVTSTNRPEQAIVDWILRETGYEAWHSEPLGILSANNRSLKVYHTPEMQHLIADVVDRFVNSEAESQAFSLRVITVGSPNWRSTGQKVLKPVATQTQGVQAWLVAKEDAALLMADLRKRTDFREHSSPHLLVNNGQPATVSATRPRSYIRDVQLRPEAWPGFQQDTGQFDEGFTLEFNPLLSLDGRSVDAVIKCNIDQLEKLVPVTVDAPTAVAPRQKAKVEVPQATHYRLHERFRWPTDQILLIDLGVVPPPSPVDPNPLNGLPLVGAPARADLLVIIEAKGRATAAAASPVAPPPAVPAAQANRYRGRY